MPGSAACSETVQPRRSHTTGGSALLPAFARFVRRLQAKLGADHRLVFELSRGEAIAMAAGTHDELLLSAHNAWQNIGERLRDELADRSELIRCDLRDQLDSGGTLWIGRVEGGVATMAITRRGSGLELYFLPLSESSVAISHCLTFPEFRGRGLYSEMLRRIVRRLCCQGVERFYVDCTEHNVASARGILKVGFRCIGRGVHYRSGRLKWKPFQSACVADPLE